MTSFWDSSEPKITPEQAVKLCDRNFGIGADGVIFALPGVNGTDYTMRIFNSDGSEPEMCGNGVRCFARFIAELENLHGKRQSLTVHTGAGLIVPEIQEDGLVKVDMGQPVLKASNVPTKLASNKNDAVVKSELVVDGVTWNVTCVSMGNPHCVTFGTKGGEDLQVDALNLAQIGPKFEHHDAFPARTNTGRSRSQDDLSKRMLSIPVMVAALLVRCLHILNNNAIVFKHDHVYVPALTSQAYLILMPQSSSNKFVQVYSPSHLKMRAWERGSGATLACGTGACATVVAAVLEGRATRKCTVDLPGGPLDIEWREEDNQVYMTGPAEVVFYGSVPL
ncbi:hypothetical protein OIU78_003107 [Salix suchowensis]|nr:hypothetical protein OIU78_003107 [Salix suchowensis]